MKGTNPIPSIFQSNIFYLYILAAEQCGAEADKQPQQQQNIGKLLVHSHEYITYILIQRSGVLGPMPGFSLRTNIDQPAEDDKQETWFLLERFHRPTDQPTDCSPFSYPVNQLYCVHSPNYFLKLPYISSWTDKGFDFWLGLGKGLGA